MNRITIYSERITPRLQYVCSFIFEDVLRQTLHLTSIPDEVEGCIIDYSQDDISGSFRICPAGLLGETGINDQYVKILWQDSIPWLFPVDGGTMPFDPFSAIFYLISRYEEYQPSRKDQYGRFSSSESIAGKNGFLHLPVVNIWIRQLVHRLAEVYPYLSVPEPETAFIPTIDIDNPWAFLHKPLYLQAGGVLKDLLLFRLKNLKNRIRVYSSLEKDPFDACEWIENIHDGSLKIFFLIGHKGKRNNKISPGNKAWRKLIARLSARFEPGIHPSFFSVEKPEIINQEKKNLEEITGTKIMASRQHFLRMKLPETYRNLIDLGIKEEFSMGYAETAGFRAGTSFSFLFYDLEKEAPASLRIFPFTIMDRCLKDYLGMTVAEAKRLISERIAVIQKYGGIFIPVWHNESLGTAGEWQGWPDVYEHMMQEAQSLNKKREGPK